MALRILFLFSKVALRIQNWRRQQVHCKSALNQLGCCLPRLRVCSFSCRRVYGISYKYSPLQLRSIFSFINSGKGLLCLPLELVAVWHFYICKDPFRESADRTIGIIPHLLRTCAITDMYLTAWLAVVDVAKLIIVNTMLSADVLFI